MLFAIVIMLSGFGCATARLYEGEKLPRDKVSKLNNWLSYDDKVLVQSIDGITDARVKGNSMELLPGTHRIVVSFTAEGYNSAGEYGFFNSIAPHSGTFESQAGHIYKLGDEKDTKKMEWSFFITERHPWEYDYHTPVIYRGTPSPIVFRAQQAQQAGQGGEVFREIENMNKLMHTYQPRTGR